MLTISSDSRDDALFFAFVLCKGTGNFGFGRPLLGLLGRRCSYSGLSPSASTCRLQAAGGSRSRSMPMPRAFQVRRREMLYISMAKDYLPPILQLPSSSGL